jgi:Beta-L-arabinofuranosidase, GH127
MGKQAMRRKKLYIQTLGIAGLLVVFGSTSPIAAQTSEIKFSALPAVGTTNVNYVSNRKPLEPLRFIKLPVTAIKPEGWLKKYLELQRDGLTGHLGEISAWLNKKDNAWLNTGGQNGWEELPYWLKGYGNLAYILNDSSMIAETKIWIEAVFKSEQPNGYFGPTTIRNGKKDLWANMIMLWALQSYYEYSGDKRVISLMTNYFKWQLTVPDDDFLKDYWENSRGGDNLLSVYWLYNITGEPFLLDLGNKIHRNTANWMDESALPNWHNVNVAQCFREPAIYSMQTADPKMLRASHTAFNLIRRIYGQVPGGMFGADENARMGYIDPRQGTETCGFVEQMSSDEIMLRISGDPFWAENAEDVAFNSYPAAVMPDFKGLRYITCPNEVISDSKDHSPGIQNSGPFLAMNPFSSRCCQHNHSQGWPYYVEHLALATPDNGVAIALYGACTANLKVADNKLVTIKEITNYPFEESVRFILNTSGEVQFPLYLRIPTWCKNGSVKINGVVQSEKLEAGKYVMIQRKWHNDDVVTLDLPMALSLKVWQLNKNSVSVNYGPLTLSLKIKERYQKLDSKATAIGDSKWQDGADASKWPSFEIFPESPWNYTLQLNGRNPLENMKVVKKSWSADNFPFTAGSVPIEVHAKGQRVPSWGIDKYGLCGVLPDADAPTGQNVEDIILIPMGAARLRISAFPVITAK